MTIMVATQRLNDSPPLDNPYYYDNKCNNKQSVNEAPDMKCEESDQPSNYKDDGNDIK